MTTNIKRPHQGKTQKTINPIYVLIGFLVFGVVCLIIGAFLDWNISSALAGDDASRWAQSFGNVFSFIPGTLCAILIMFVGSLLILGQPHKFKLRWTKIIYLIIAYLLVSAAVTFCVYDGCVRELEYSFNLHSNSAEQTKWLHTWAVLYAAIGAIVGMVVSSLLVQYLIRGGTNKAICFKWALYVFIIIAIQWLIIFLLKTNISRERYESIIIDQGGDLGMFKPWYSLIWNQSAGSGFPYASFPSGHTNWASTLIPIIIITILMFNRKLPLQIISIIFVATIIVVTMFARIQSGYHYLSDTAMTVFIASICNIAVYLGVYKLNLIKLPK